MNPRNTWLLALLTAGLFAFIYFYESRLKPSPPLVLKVLPDLRAVDVTSLQIRPPHDQAEIRIVRTNGIWRMQRPVDYPVQTEYVDRLLLALERLTPQRRLAASELKDSRHVGEDFGFKNPQYSIVVEKGDDQSTLYLGSLTAPGDQLYAQVVGREVVDVLGTDILKLLPQRADDWRDTTLLDLDPLAFDRIDVTNGDHGMSLQRNNTNLLWRMVAPDKARADNWKIEQLLGGLQSLRVAGFASDNPTADDLVAFGLRSPALELQFFQGTNQRYSLQLGKSLPDNTNLVYGRVNGQRTIVKVPAVALAGWRDEPDKFRDRHLINLTDVISSGAGGLPDCVEISNQAPQESFAICWKSLGTNGGTWIVTNAAATNWYPADAGLLGEFLTNLDNLVQTGDRPSFHSSVPESEWSNYGLNPPLRSYTLKRGEPATVLAKLDLGFTNKDDGNIFARRGDVVFDPSIYTVSSNIVSDLPTQMFKLRSRVVWGIFEPSLIANISIIAGGRATTFNHTGKYKWELATATDPTLVMDGNKEMYLEGAVESLGVLTAYRWVELGDEHAADYGFNAQPPRITLTFTNNPPLQLSVEFGNQSPDGNRYARAKLNGGQNWVFELSNLDWTKLTSWLPVKLAP